MDEILNLIESVPEGFPSYFFRLSISDGFVKTINYDKRDDFDIVNFPFLW